ncbi:transcriptional regulator, GntR family [Albimonas donghaensis]|uniref:Transcriptional regulator, GntR family n=1 Tax=Albimonas donghaensis TaxID=356660 RepID=A0A1H3B1G4_9RHOB|nr:GntR family transcriptional regulator [Albimonas donghaensis]SDX35782.1 transcriptional regulator, GntR family [Albimonas donghaensis]
MPPTPSRFAHAYRALRQAILEGDLKPGARLPEDEIGLPFGISRTLVRQALQRLQADGLVDMGGKRTATVARPTLAEARDVFRVRRALEREAIRILAETWTPAHGARLEGHLRAEAEALAAGDDRASVRLAWEFHVVLAELTGNALMETWISQLVARCSLILALHGRPHSPDCSVGEHRAVLDALRDADAERAAGLMDHHLHLVEGRALDAPEAREPDLSDILSRYAAEAGAPAAARPLRPKGGKS